MKNDLRTTDTFKIEMRTLFSSLDNETALSLYMPLVGASAISVYLSFAYWKRKDSIEVSKFLDSTQLSIGQLIGCLTALEAVSLIETYVKENGDGREILFAVYSPLSPKAFFVDPLFAGTLRKYIGKEEAASIASEFAVPSSGALDEYENVSESFISYFSPDFNDKSYGKSLHDSGDSIHAEPKTYFDEGLFVKRLIELDPRFHQGSLTEEEIRKAGRYASLYGYDEETTADFAFSSFSFSSPLGKRLNMDALASSMRDNLKYDYMSSPKAAPKTKGDSSLARMIRSMDELTPVEFLKRLQKGHKPATSDLRLLEKLSEETGLAPGATNALVFFVLSKNGVLSPLYVEKIGASLVREGIETAIDAMNYFNRTSKKKKPSEPIAEENKVTVEQIKENEGKEGEDDSFEKVVSSLHWKKRKSE